MFVVHMLSRNNNIIFEGMLKRFFPLSVMVRQSASGLVSRAAAGTAKAFSTVEGELKHRPFSVELRDTEGSNASRNLRKGLYWLGQI